MSDQTTSSAAPKAVSPVHGGEIGKIRSFLLDHEKLLIVLILAIVCWWGYGKYADIRANEADKALQEQKLVVAAQVQQNAALAVQAQKDAAQAAADKAALQALSDKVAAQNQQLVAANTALAVALTKQQKVDAALPVPELVNRWAELVPGTNFKDAVGAGNNVTVTPSNALATVDKLEEGRTDKAKLVNETALYDNEVTLFTAANKSIFDLGTSIGTLNASVAGKDKLIADNQKQCTDEKNVMKAQFRKSKRRWFVVGYVAGFVSRQAIKSYLGF
jgi:cell division protein FtsB